MSDEITTPPAGTPAPPELDTRLDRVLRWFRRASTALLALGLPLTLAWPDAFLARLPIHAGIILLLASPGARLVVITGVHAHRRQWRVAVMAAVTLAIMMVSLVAGLVAVWRTTMSP
ncbi:MAG: hypothetical protein ACLGHP_01285 [Vicinamibacteria bacterium]